MTRRAEAGAQVADRGAGRRWLRLQPVRPQPIHEGPRLHPINQTRLGETRHPDIGDEVQPQADEDAQSQRILHPHHDMQMPGGAGRQLGQRQHDDPHENPDAHARQSAMGMPAAPQHSPEQGRRQLGHGGEGHQTHGGQPARLVRRLIIKPGQQKHGDDGAAPHLQDRAGHVRRVASDPPSVTGQEGQDQTVGDHGRQGHGLDDHHGRGGREAADKHDGRQPGLTPPERQGQHQKIGVRRRREQGPRRD